MKLKRVCPIVQPTTRWPSRLIESLVLKLTRNVLNLYRVFMNRKLLKTTPKWSSVRFSRLKHELLSALRLNDLKTNKQLSVANGRRLMFKKQMTTIVGSVTNPMSKYIAQMNCVSDHFIEIA